MSNFTTDTPIAFLGMGLMGSRMSQRLLDAGFAVAVWNRSPQACDALLEKGATALKLEDIANYPIVMFCLADDAAVCSVIQRIQTYLQAGQVCIDFSSLSVDTTLRLANTLSDQNIQWVDSPVSGGVMGAEHGSLVIFAGGDAELIQSLAPIYAPLAQRITCMGSIGTGQATKICNQLIVAATSTLIAEAVALAENSGVDTHLLASALAGGFADSKPFQILTPRMANKNFEPIQWKVQTLSKDLNNAIVLAEKIGLNLPMANHALVQLKQHQQHGFAEHDLSTLILNVSADHT